jgi:predicted nuclease with TOPRIM domain
MEDTNAQLNQIKLRIKSLVAKFKQIEIEKDRLLQQNETLTASLAERDKKIEEIQNKNINLQISRALGKGGAGEADLKQRLDEYIKEIEATIAHLKD